MDIRNYLAILWRRKWIVVITAFVTVLIVVVGTFTTAPIYSATATMRIASASSGTMDYYDYMYADRLTNTYIRLATTAPVLDELKKRINLSVLPPIEVTSIPNTELIQINVEDRDPSKAALVANTLADILFTQSMELYTGGGKSSLEILAEQVTAMETELNQARSDYLNIKTKTPDDAGAIQAALDTLNLEQEMYSTILDQYEQARLKQSIRANSISIVEQAAIPLKPTKPRKELNIALGFFAGIIGGLGVAFVYENIYPTLYTTDQIENATKLQPIGKVPALENGNLTVGLNGNISFEESFRLLRTNIFSLDFPVKTLLITSAEPKDGKSRIAANLACTVALSGKKVIVIDADLWLPTQHSIFDIDNKIGLSSILSNKVTVTEAVRSSEFQGVFILPSGPLPTNPSELLGSDQMAELISQFSANYDLVIIDSPAILAVADAAVLAPDVDAVAFVVCRAKTSARAVKTAMSQLSRVKTKWIGVIENRAERNHNQYYYYHGSFSRS